MEFYTSFDAFFSTSGRISICFGARDASSVHVASVFRKGETAGKRMAHL